MGRTSRSQTPTFRRDQADHTHPPFGGGPITHTHVSTGRAITSGRWPRADHAGSPRGKSTGQPGVNPGHGGCLCIRSRQHIPDRGDPPPAGSQLEGDRRPHLAILATVAGLLEVTAVGDATSAVSRRTDVTSIVRLAGFFREDSRMPFTSSLRPASRSRRRRGRRPG